MKLSIVEIKENEDGTKSLVLDYDDEMLEIVKKEIGKDDPSEEEINDFLVQIIAAQILSKQEKDETDS